MEIDINLNINSADILGLGIMSNIPNLPNVSEISIHLPTDVAERVFAYLAEGYDK